MSSKFIIFKKPKLNKNQIEDFNKLLPNSDLSWIDKCGHAPMMEHPNDFNKIMEDWLFKNNL